MSFGPAPKSDGVKDAQTGFLSLISDLASSTISTLARLIAWASTQFNLFKIKRFPPYDLKERVSVIPTKALGQDVAHSYRTDLERVEAQGNWNVKMGWFESALSKKDHDHISSLRAEMSTAHHWADFYNDTETKNQFHNEEYDLSKDVDQYIEQRFFEEQKKANNGETQDESIATFFKLHSKAREWKKPEAPNQGREDSIDAQSCKTVAEMIEELHKSKGLPIEACLEQAIPSEIKRKNVSLFLTSNLWQAKG